MKENRWRMSGGRWKLAAPVLGFGLVLLGLNVVARRDAGPDDAGGADKRARTLPSADRVPFTTGAPTSEAPPVELFFQAALEDGERAEAALRRIRTSWRDGYAPLFVDLLRFLRPFTPGSQRIVRSLEERTGRSFGSDLNAWRQWLWGQELEPHPHYARFKGLLLANVDPRMEGFFRYETEPRIRLDEIVWGGVRVNGIPPLDHPDLISAEEADYLEDDHIVFGLALEGEAKAYPKRLLAWHEMAKDAIGGTELTIVYCTLCGTVIPYESVAGGKLRTMGTSGLLYRSNKLMFDEETGSLWSTVTGEPVVGPLVGIGLKLKPHPVVTTTWGEWRELHPNTRVLSLETGFSRDYSEGAAYREYFATDELMFEVPSELTDRRLPNKREVLALLVEPSDDFRLRPLAIDTGFLRKHPVYPFSFAGRELLVLTTPGGANRVFETQGVRFPARTGEEAARAAGRAVRDASGRTWRVTEGSLVAEGGDARLPRLPARRAFWFGWYAQYPETRLIEDN
jgi:hypothetical protein